jgi:predicted dehydrogenase
MEKTERIINVGIAGFGKAATVFHVPLLKNNPRFTVKKIFERSTNYSKTICPESITVRSFQDILCDDIDLVVLCTPNHLHYEMAKQALLANKHVVVEKPFVVKSAEASELDALAKKKGLVLSIFHNRRWDGGFLTIKKLMQCGLLGKTVDYEAHFDRYTPFKHSSAWKESNSPGTGVLYDLGVHLLDQVVQLFGMPQEVYADLRIERENTVIVDNCHVALYYPDKKAVLSSSKLVREQGPHIAIHGTQGSYVKFGWDPQENQLMAGCLPADKEYGLESREAWGILNTEIAGAPLRCAVETERGNYTIYYTNIYNAIIKGAGLMVTPEQARDVLRIIEAAIESNEKKSRITLR